MTKPQILGIGSSHIDLYLQVDESTFAQFAPPKSRVLDRNSFEDLKKDLVKRCPGGCAANTIRVLAQLGERCAFLSCVGNDKAGSFFLENLKELQIHSHVSVLPDFTTIQLICLVNPKGEKRILYPDIKEPATSFKEAYFQGIDWTHIDSFQFEIGNDLEKAMAFTSSPVSFNLGNAEIAAEYRDPILSFLEKRVDLLFGNEEEIQSLTQLSSEDGCLRLQEICPIVVMTRGNKGCLIVSKNGLISLPALPIKAIDSTGAGDFFAGGFLFGYRRGYSLKQCGILGNLLGSAVCEVLGTELPEKKWMELRIASQEFSNN